MLEINPCDRFLSVSLHVAIFCFLQLNFHRPKSSLHAVKTEAEEFKQKLNGNTSILSSTAKDAVQPQSASVVAEPDPKQLTLVQTKREKGRERRRFSMSEWGDPRE